jgi:hypothetical protein
LRRIIATSCALPTANAGIRRVPPLSTTSRAYSTNDLSSLSLGGCGLWEYVDSDTTTSASGSGLL